MANQVIQPEPTRQLASIIDVHSHAQLPIGFQIPAPLIWSPDMALDLMDKYGVSMLVLSVPDAANHATGQQASDIARRMNEALAGIVQQHPTRFGAMATLPGLEVEGCLQEMAYALDTLGLDGVATSTSLNDMYLGDARFDPWFEEMNRRAVTLFIHPTMANAARSVDMGLNPSILEFMFDTTRMLTNLVFSGAKARFKDIKMVSTHAGGTIPYLVTRLQTLESTFGPGPGRQPLSPEEVKAGFASFYYDLTAATSAAQLDALAELVPTSRLLMGLDIPYMPESSFEPAIQDLERWPGFIQSDLDRIAFGNAMRLYPTIAARIGYKEQPS